MCRRRPCFTAHATPPWLACADLAHMAHTGGITRLRARSDAQFRHLNLAWRFEADAAGGSRVAVLREIELRLRFLQRSLELLAPTAAGEILRAFADHACQRRQPPGGA